MAKIHWVSAPSVSDDARAANAVAIAALGLPKHRGAGRLAVVGGGPSIRDHIEELRNWDGAIWAVNGAINWCLDNGIKALFYTADALPPDRWVYDLGRVRSAVLPPSVSPELVKLLLALGAKVELACEIESGPTSANATDYLAIDADYTSVHYFGCEGSFAPDSTHAFPSAEITDWMQVNVGGDLHFTKAEFISQAIIMARTISAFPHIYQDRSGGLLASILKHGPEYDVTRVSDELFAKLKFPTKKAA